MAESLVDTVMMCPTTSRDVRVQTVLFTKLPVAKKQTIVPTCSFYTYMWTKHNWMGPSQAHYSTSPNVCGHHTTQMGHLQDHVGCMDTVALRVPFTGPREQNPFHHVIVYHVACTKPGAQPNPTPLGSTGACSVVQMIPMPTQHLEPNILNPRALSGVEDKALCTPRVLHQVLLTNVSAWLR